MNLAQWQGAARHTIAAFGEIAATVAIFSPHWGAAAQGIVAALGAALSAGMLIASTLAPEKRA